ncbi:MAG TPA: thiamine pyrophosphate-binding protein [Terriglobales bacterium]|nr:thiamine pyrophosphate-binding protein [Terriglobales bacterium]
MVGREYNGSELICKTLEHLGVTDVFGLPGTQNLALFEALRTSKLRTVLATHEGAAGFMANGYFRASGRIGVFTTISGPGFTNALTALAEAKQDSAAVLYIVNAPPEGTRKFRLQALDQAAIASNIAKAVFMIETAGDAVQSMLDAYTAAVSGEPGPVLVQVSSAALKEMFRVKQSMFFGDRPIGRSQKEVDAAQLNSVLAMLRAARRPVIYAGQGCNLASDKLIQVAELMNSPVIMTRSARGVLPMDHRLALAFDFNGTGATGCSAVLNAADLVLVLGCKLGHNGTAGFRIEFPPDRTVHVDASEEVLGANYQTALSVQADVNDFLTALLLRSDEFANVGRSWSDEDLEPWRAVRRAEWGEGPAEPEFSTTPTRKAGAFFNALRAVLPRDAILVTDSGLHQVLSFRYWRSLCPGGIIAPSDFQSMGFGLPAAIGAKLACSEREVVVVMGDGGLAMSGMELLTAVRERVQLGVLIFTDEALGQIRLQQLGSYGASHATTLSNPDISLLAEAVGANYTRLEGDTESSLRKALAQPGVNVVEVPLGDSSAMKTVRAKAVARRTVTRVVGRRTLGWLKSPFK